MSTASPKKPRSKAIKPRLIASADAARMLGVEPDTFRGRVVKGLAPLPFARQGNLYYYRVADIEHFCDHGRWPDGMQWYGQDQDQDQDRPSDESPPSPSA